MSSLHGVGGESTSVSYSPPHSARGNNIKRGVRETQENEDSSVRRSKRVKSEVQTSRLDVGEETKDTKLVSRSVSRKTKQEIGIEEADQQREIESHAQNQQDKPKGSRKRKTKEEKEAEMQPLAARTTGLRMQVGAHVSAAKGVFNAVNNSTHIGGNAFALFLKSQRKWDNPPLQDEHATQFRDRCLEQKYDGSNQILPHGSYLVNLAQEDKAKAKQAYDSFVDDLKRCEALGIKLYNFHPGSANQTSHTSALTRLANTLTKALSSTTTVTPVLETMCGHGTTIGGNLHDFHEIITQIPEEYHPRIGICIDTCHSFSAGYDLVSPTGFKSFMDEFEALVGCQFLKALHLNDSKAPGGSKRDLHANIGTGFLGLRAFHNVMNEKRFEGLPLILETPIDRPVGGDKNGSVDDEEGEGEGEGEESDMETNIAKPKPKKPKSAAKSKPKTAPDPSIWAREIKLLESLIGMDVESDEFRRLETNLAEEGREMRQKHLEQYQRKLETEEKKRIKEMEKEEKKKGKGQKDFVDMMGGKGSRSGRKSNNSKKGEESDGESEDGCC